MNELNIAKTLLQKRREKGVTQDDIATYIGVSKASVSKWETGQSYPDIVLLPQLAAYFNISVDELIGYEPQMVKEDIQKLYLRLSADFTQKPFHDVRCEIKEIVKKYFSCFPLLFQMGSLLLNHYMLAEESQKQEVIQDAINLFSHVKEDSKDFTLCKMSNAMLGVCYFALCNPAKTIELLEDTTTPAVNEQNLLATAYMMSGNLERANEILQVEIYQNLLSILQNLASLLTCDADLACTKEIMGRIHRIAEAFDVKKLHPTTLLSIYLNAATAYASQNDYENALESLKDYCDLALSTVYPTTLHSDKFFNKIEGWLEELDLGVNAPRNERTIRRSILDSVTKNPAFLCLNENDSYQNITKRLSTILGGSQPWDN